MNENNNSNLVLIEKDFNFAVNSAVKLYKSGDVFVYPTDTIYGFGGNPFDGRALKRIFEIKGRDENQQFIFLIKDFGLLQNYVFIKGENKQKFLENIWPAPISVVLELKKYPAQKLGFQTAAFRVPDNKFCSVLLSKINAPLISTSVNSSGKSPLDDENLIYKEFGSKVELIFYSKKKIHQSASTIIDLTANLPKLIREGTIKFETILQKYYS